MAAMTVKMAAMMGHDGKDGSHDGKDGSGHDDYGQMSVGVE